MCIRIENENRNIYHRKLGLKSSSGQKSVNKGFKYFSDGYIHDLKGM
jgi:hypothetical protein